MKIKKRFILSVILLLSVAPNLRPCSTPVFRYALEFWPPDPYQFVIYSSEPDVLAEKKSFEKIRLYSFAGDSTLNITVEQRTASTETKGEMWAELYYPAITRIRQPLWQGEVSAENSELLVTSNLRTELFQRLVAGQAAVWVFLPGPNGVENERAEAVLRTSLRQLSDSLTVPVTGYDADGLPLARTDTTTYAVQFSFLKIDPADTTENLLRQMLLGIEPDLMDYEAPVAIPVFGRGRALYGLVGRGINRTNIAETCQSLLNWCSCQVKEENPGVDLLMQADWSQIQSMTSQNDELPALIGFESFLPETVPPPDTTLSKLPDLSEIKKSVFSDTTLSQPVDNDSMAQSGDFEIETVITDEQSSALVRNVILLFVLLIVLMVAGTFVIKRRG